MKKIIALLLVLLLVLSSLTALAATYNKDIVKQVQQALNDAGYNCGTPDGIAGKKTTAAITQYQTDNGLAVTGEIDDALLEAMGISIAQESDQDEEASQTTEEMTLHDFVNLSYYYNLALLYRLQGLGIDIENNEDIGQSAYLITNIEQCWGTNTGYIFKSETFDLTYMPTEESLRFEYTKDDLQALSFLDHAALHTFCFTAQSLYEGIPEDWDSIIAEQIGDVPAIDGTVPIENKEFRYSSAEYYIESRESCFEAGRPIDYMEDSWVTGDDVPAIPDVIVAEMGGLPETIDENWARYDLIQDLSPYSTISTGCSAGEYEGGLYVKMKDDDTIYIIIHLMDKQYYYQTWVGIYDQDGKLAEKNYLNAYSNKFENQEFEENIQEEEDQDRDLSHIPAEIIEATGGIPESLDELADRYDWHDIKTVSDQWDGMSMIVGLLEEASFTISDLKYDLDSGKLVLVNVTLDEDNNIESKSEENKSVDLKISKSGNTTMLTLDEIQQPAEEYNCFELSLSCSNGYNLFSRVLYTQSDSANPYLLDWEKVDMKTTTEFDNYSEVEYVVQYNRAYQRYEVYLSYTLTDDGSYHSWVGHYDENGKLLEVM